MSKEISKDEAAIYDRQIRLWGLDAQQRIGKANILIAGMRALSDEVCKNLALAGVASITLLDHETVTDFDLGAQFFLTTENVGQNKAEAAAPSIRNLNPRVEVIVDKQNIEEKSDEFFQSFDVVCLIHSNYAIMNRVDQLRRAVNKPFYAGDAFGWFGYIFCDLKDHTYHIKTTTNPPKGSDEKPKVTNVTHTATYNSLEESLKKSWKDARPKILKRIPSLNFAVRILLKFQKENGRSPTEEDVDALVLTKDKYLGNMGIEDDSILDGDLLREVVNLFDTEISSIAAIVGGILAQDILRTLSANELPIQNWFYFDGLSASGSVHNI